MGDWSYRESTSDDGDTVYVLDGYYGSDASVTLPGTLDGKQMYSVRFGATGLPKTVTSVTIPASIKEIGRAAFYGSKVTSVTFAANSQLTTIEQSAFAKTSLIEFTLPASVRTLGPGAFSDSSLTKLTLNAALDPMVYTSKVISGGSTVETTMHYNPCSGCSNLTFAAPSDCQNYRVENGALLSKDGTVLYAQMSNLGGGTYTVPSSVQCLGASALYGNGTFSQIVLPQGLTTMEGSCLGSTSITSLDMPDSVTQVQGGICTGCTSLTSVRLSNNLEELGTGVAGCFYRCSNLTNVTLGSKLRIIGSSCFGWTKLASVDLPASLEQVNSGAFSNISTLKSVTGATGLRYIYSDAFSYTGLTGFPFGENLEFVSKTAFDSCKFTPSYPSYMDEQSDGYHAYHDTFAMRGTKSYDLAWQVLDLVNQERAKENIAPLTMDAELLDAAMQRAAEINVCFSHTRPTGSSCFTACAKMSRENVAFGSSTAAGVMEQWMDSEGHRKNILSSDSKSIGIGCVKIGNYYFWAQCFSRGEASAVSQPADASNALMLVDYAADTLASLDTSFSIRPVSSDGSSVVSTSGALQEGTSQRYALFVHPCSTNYNFVCNLIDNSCIAWSLSGAGAKLNASTATVTGTDVGSFTLTASVGGGTVQQTLTRETCKAIYTVSFNSNGGTSVAKQSVTSGEKVAKPADPTRTSYTFTGWYSDSGLKQAYDFGTAVTGNMTLYAGWEQDVPARFKDVDYGAWYGDWVTYASQNGLMTGLKDAAESPGNDELAAADEPDVNAAPADSADITEPDTADTFTEPVESDEAPAADATGAPDLTEAASFDSFADALAA